MDNINNTQAPEPKESNKKLIIISTIAIVVLVAAFVVVGLSLGWFGKKDTSKNGVDKTAPTISVVESKGSDAATKKIKIKVRDVKFGDKLKEVKAFEKTQKDTLDNPSQATTKDGYTYMTYTFSPKAEFFGVKTADSTKGSLLQYVFKKKRLFDIRIQFGDISKKDQKKVRKYLNKKYGKPTNYVKYSNDSWMEWWKTENKDPDKQTLLTLNYSPNSGLIVSYESIGRDFGKK